MSNRSKTIVSEFDVSEYLAEAIQMAQDYFRMDRIEVTVEMNDLGTRIIYRSRNLEEGDDPRDLVM
jgi:hypothetical protein